MDSPVGAGFSFSREPRGYDVGDISSTLHIYDFLIKVSFESLPVAIHTNKISCVPVNVYIVLFICSIGIQWFNDHPEFLANPFYVGGDSYAGKIAPFLTQIISEGIDCRCLLYITEWKFIIICSCLYTIRAQLCGIIQALIPALLNGIAISLSCAVLRKKTKK